MSTKDYILILISASALTLSLISLIITLVQKSRETDRTIRKNLSDTLEGISKIAIETAKLRASKDIDPTSGPIILLRRNYNTQRRTLIAHADFLVKKYDSLVTDIDCNVLASAYSTIGDIEKAEENWRKALEKSDSAPIRMMNLRGFASFWFGIGEIEKGRRYFIESLTIPLQENEQNKAMRIDTYMMFCDQEAEHGNAEAGHECLEAAMEILATINNSHRKEELHREIEKRLQRLKKITAS